MIREDYDFLIEKIEKFLSLVCPYAIKEEVWDRVKDMELPRSQLSLVITLLEGINSCEDRITCEEFARAIGKMERIKGVECPVDLITGFWNHCRNLDSKSFEFVMETIFEKQEKIKRTSYHYNS